MLSTGTTLISSYRSGMASRVLLENSHTDPDFPRSTRSTNMSSVATVAADGSHELLLGVQRIRERALGLVAELIEFRGQATIENGEELTSEGRGPFAPKASV